ncbi:MAG: hypothetical protein WDN67_02060 [Candidatus Moraniibacteriota bacterium]
MPTYQEFAALARKRFQENQASAARQSGEFFFTEHARYKMQQYRLSEQKVKGIVRRPRREEKGIAPRTVAVMQPSSTKKEQGKETWKQEIWVMYREKAKKGMPGEREKRIISAWRYPGVSPERDPVPADIWRELEENAILEPEN